MTKAGNSAGTGDFKPATEDFAERVRDSFAKQGMMATLGAELGEIEPGFYEIRMPYADAVAQQHGYIHGGAIATIADSAGGYAGLTLFDADDGILTVEFKLNLIAPAKGEMLIACGHVVKPGRTLTVTRADVVAVENGRETTCAVMQQTLMRIVGRDGVTG